MHLDKKLKEYELFLCTNYTITNCQAQFTVVTIKLKQTTVGAFLQLWMFNNVYQLLPFTKTYYVDMYKFSAHYIKQFDAHHISNIRTF